MLSTVIDGIERRVRVLEDDLDVGREFASLRSCDVADGLAAEADRPFGHGCETQDGAADGGLARAGFADKAQGLSGLEFEGDLIDHGLCSACGAPW